VGYLDIKACCSLWHRRQTSFVESTAQLKHTGCSPKAFFRTVFRRPLAWDKAASLHQPCSASPSIGFYATWRWSPSSGAWSFRRPRIRRRYGFFVKSTGEAVSSLNSFSETASAFGFRWPKTKLQNLGTGTQPPAIVVDSMDNFIYLGSVLSSDGYSRPDMNRRFGLASSVTSALSHIWKDRRLSLTTKPVFIRRQCYPCYCIRSRNFDSSRCRF